MKDKNLHFACIYTKRFSLIRGSNGFIRKMFALICESFVLIRESFEKCNFFSLRK